MRRYESDYRINEGDDVLGKENAIHQDVDLRLDAIELLGQAFAEGNRADIEALIAAYRDTVSGLARQVEDLLGEASGGISADAIAETADRLFLTAARRALILSDLRGGVDASGDTMAKLFALIAGVIGGAPAGRQNLKALNDAILANTATLSAITGGADPTLDSFAEALTRFVIDEGQISSLMTMVGNRVRVDADMGLTQAKKRQARFNIGAGGSVGGVSAATTLTVTNLNTVMYFLAGPYTVTLPRTAVCAFGDYIEFTNLQTSIITIARDAADTSVIYAKASGATASVDVGPGQSIRLTFEGTNWIGQGRALAPEYAQAALGYTPVRQGTGVGQLNNLVNLGWSSLSALKATVDTSDLGRIWTDSLMSVLVSTSGYFKLPFSGGTIIVQWTSVDLGATADKVFTWPVAFPNALLSHANAIETGDASAGTAWTLKTDGMSTSGGNVRARVTANGGTTGIQAGSTIARIIGIGY